MCNEYWWCKYLSLPNRFGGAKYPIVHTVNMVTEQDETGKKGIVISGLLVVDANSKLIDDQINGINQKLRLLESNINNITNLAYNLDFALKRIERHLELSSIQKKDNSQNVSNSNNKEEYKIVNKPEIKQENLEEEPLELKEEIDNSEEK